MLFRVPVRYKFTKQQNKRKQKMNKNFKMEEKGAFYV